METTDLEGKNEAHNARIWRHRLHVSTQRNQMFRFSLAYLGVLIGALTWLLLQEVGPWICTPLGLLVSALSVFLAAFDLKLNAQQRNLGDGPRSFQGSVSAPIYGAYAAFALLGLFLGILPLLGRPLFQRSSAHVSAFDGRSNSTPPPGSGFAPENPFGQPPTLARRTPPPITNRTLPGTTPMPNPRTVFPPPRTPDGFPTPFKEPTGSPASPASNPQQ